MHNLLRQAVAVGLTVGLGAASTAFGQTLQDDMEQLKKGQAEILKQLQALKQQIGARPAQARPSVPNVQGKVLDLMDHPVKGASTAKLTLVEFSDYQ